jgi:hypothetical protein
MVREAAWNFFVTYDTPRMVTIRNNKLGVVRAMMA